MGRNCGPYNKISDQICSILLFPLGCCHVALAWRHESLRVAWAVALLPRLPGCLELLGLAELLLDAVILGACAARWRIPVAPYKKISDQICSILPWLLKKIIGQICSILPWLLESCHMMCSPGLLGLLLAGFWGLPRLLGLAELLIDAVIAVECLTR